jgi:hypothetical protein
MNCDKAQRMFGDMADGKLSAAVVAELRAHLAECTDCRVAQQRTVRLQQLLAIKRHENPGSAYFNNFLNDFHRRLEVETAPQPGWREMLAGQVEMVASRFWQYGLAGAVGVCVLGISLWYSGKNTSPATVAQEQNTDVAEMKPAEVIMPVAMGLPVETVSFGGNAEGFAPSGVIVLPSAVRAERSAPRYVLDRVTATPVSYETASCDF